MMPVHAETFPQEVFRGIDSHVEPINFHACLGYAEGGYNMDITNVGGRRFEGLFKSIELQADSEHARLEPVEGVLTLENARPLFPHGHRKGPATSEVFDSIMFPLRDLRRGVATRRC